MKLLRLAPLLAAAGAAAVAASAGAAGGFPRFGNGCARDDFSSGGTTMRAELCRATGGGAAVIVLHGCGGFSTFDHRLATTLPRDGISTLDVDYFGATPPPGKKGFCNAHGAAGTAFGTWIRTAEDAASALRAVPGVRRVGAVGWSLGGGVVVAAAADTAPHHPFAAIAGFSTGSFGGREPVQLQERRVRLRQTR